MKRWIIWQQLSNLPGFDPLGVTDECIWHCHWSTTGRSEPPARWQRETYIAL